MYGPADMPTIKLWCAEGRIGPGTSLIDAATQRSFHASELPELQGSFGHGAQSPYLRPPAGSTAQPQQTQYGQYANAPQPMSAFHHYPYAYQPKSKLAAGLLAFFLGGLGIHRFYLGYTGIGIAMLLITVLTCGYGGIITGPWALIEMILIFCDQLPDAQGQKLMS